VTAATAIASARGWRVGLLVAVALAAGVVAVLLPPIRQDLAYHDFADRRAILGIPYGLNVLSNAGFVLAGLWALARVGRAALPTWERAAGLVFAFGLLLTGLGDEHGQGIAAVECHAERARRIGQHRARHYHAAALDSPGALRGPDPSLMRRVVPFRP